MLYIAKPTSRPKGLFTTDRITVRYGVRTSVKEVRQTAIGPIATSTIDGVARTRLRIALHEPVPAVGGASKRTEDVGGFYGHSARQADIEKVLRVLTPEDEEKLGQHDEVVAEAFALLREVRGERAVFVAEAWKRAERVSAGVLAREAEQRQQERPVQTGA